MQRLLLCGVAAIAITCAGSAAAYSQTTDATAAQSGETVAGGTAPIPQEDEQGIGDIIVTAQRRAESLQRAAIAISVLQGESLAAVTAPQDLSKLVPAVQIGSAGGAAPLYYIRGVGTFSANPYTDSAVAINNDGIYLARPSSTFGLFYDLDRVEVLKGPQGTLYGRNATGGALNVIPTRPRLGETSVAGSLSYGNYDSVLGQAAINLPVSDTIALRVAGTRYSHDAYNSDDTYSERGVGGRAQLLFQPSDDLSIRIAGDYFKLTGTGPTGVIIAANGNSPGGSVATGFGTRVGMYDPRSVAILNSAFVSLAGAVYGPLSGRPSQNNDYYGLNTEITKDLGFAQLTFIGGWRRSELDSFTQAANNVIQQIETDEQYSGELRLAGSIGRVDWLAGGFLFRETVDSLFSPNTNLIGTLQQLDATNRSWAGFGRLTWNITDRLRVAGAARQTHDTKTFVGTADIVVGVCTLPTRVCPNARRLPGDLSDLTAALASIGYIRPPGAAAFIDVRGTSGLIYSPTRIAVDDRLSDDQLTYRAAVEYEPRPGSLLYGSLETGYRSGGFSFSSVRPTYDPETITAYTIGAKNRFLDNRLQLNLEAFVWRYKDQQISHQATGATGGLEFVTENIGASTNRGVEVELTARPLRNTTLYADVQYLDARNHDFVFTEPDSSGRAGLPPGTIPSAVNCPATPVPGTGTYRIDCSGLRPLRSPRWTVNLGAQQTVPLSSRYDLLVEANTHYQSDSIVMFERRAFSVQEAYWLTDAGVTFAPRDKRWGLTAFVNNISNVSVLGNAFYNGSTGLTTGVYGPPRTYGARVRFAF